MQRLWTSTISRLPAEEHDTLDQSYAFFTTLVACHSIDPLLLRPLLEGNAARKPAATLSRAGLICMYTMTRSINVCMGYMIPDETRVSALSHLCGHGSGGSSCVHVASGTGKLISMDYIFDTLVNSLSEELAEVAKVMLVETFVVPYTAFSTQTDVWGRCAPALYQCLVGNIKLFVVPGSAGCCVQAMVELSSKSVVLVVFKYNKLVMRYYDFHQSFRWYG